MTEWIEWKGGECPVDADTIVDVRFRAGVDVTGPARVGLRWSHTGGIGDIIAYRIHAPSPSPVDGPVEALRRIADATPESTNSHSAKAMASWTQAVARQALAEYEASK